jgi:hypothetical protein
MPVPGEGERLSVMLVQLWLVESRTITNPPESDSKSLDPQVREADQDGSATSVEAPTRRRRREGPKITPRERPSRVSKKAPHYGRCDYIDPEGGYCNQRQTRGSEACPCHFVAHDQKHGFAMPPPRPSSGDVPVAKPMVFVKMIPNELARPPEWYQRPQPTRTSSERMAVRRLASTSTSLASA